MDHAGKAEIRSFNLSSFWNMVLLPPKMIAFIYLVACAFHATEQIHMVLYPGQNFATANHGLGVVIAVIAPVFGALPLSMLFGNWLGRMIPSIQRKIGAEGRPREASFHLTQKQLVKESLILVPASIILSIVGILLPWFP